MESLLYWEGFSITLNIAVVDHLHIYNPSKSPFEKGDLVALSLSQGLYGEVIGLPKLILYVKPSHLGGLFFYPLI